MGLLQLMIIFLNNKAVFIHLDLSSVSEDHLDDDFTTMSLPVISKIVCAFFRNEKDHQGENMFMRCVSELVIESREVGWGYALGITVNFCFIALL